MKWYTEYLSVYEKPFDKVTHSVIEKVRTNIACLQSDQPLVTVSVIGYNEEKHLLACLWSLSETKCKYPIEIIGVDNDSKDRTADIFRALEIPFYTEYQHSCGFARSCGLAHARGKYHLNIDSDTMYPPHYVETMIDALSQKGVVAASSLWSYIPDKDHPWLGLKIYELTRDIYLFMQSFKRPELSVRGLVFGYNTELGRKIGIRTDIIRGEDGSLALGLKEYGRIKFIRNRSARAVTGYGTVSADGSLFNSFKKRAFEGLRKLHKIYTKQVEYKDVKSNLIEWQSKSQKEPCKILLVNNYDMKLSREIFLQGECPSHHQFGTNELINSKEYTVDYMLVAPQNYPSKILKLLSLIPIWIQLYKIGRKYDIVYGAADFTIDLLGVIKKIGLFKPLLIAIFHHPPFLFRLKCEDYDQILFLSHFAYQDMKIKLPRLAKKMQFIQWGADLNFYRRYAPIPNYQIEKNEIIFISNGKTCRDHEILLQAAEETACKTIIVCDTNSIPSNYNEETCKHCQIFIQNRPNDINMVKLLNQCSVLVIPTPKTQNRLGPIGLTSLLDATALGMPIISADNTVFTETITENKMGLIYETGNLKSLKESMVYLKDHTNKIISFGENAYQFGLKNNIETFAKHLHSTLNKTLS